MQDHVTLKTVMGNEQRLMKIQFCITEIKSNRKPLFKNVIIFYNIIIFSIFWSNRLNPGLMTIRDNQNSNVSQFLYSISKKYIKCCINKKVSLNICLKCFLLGLGVSNMNYYFYFCCSVCVRNIRLHFQTFIVIIQWDCCLKTASAPHRDLIWSPSSQWRSQGWPWHYVVKLPKRRLKLQTACMYECIIFQNISQILKYRLSCNSRSKLGASWYVFLFFI